MVESNRKFESTKVDWGSDIVAGAIVALVALPLCLGIALASGAPLVSGLITGIVGGLVVSRFGGTQLLVSGPAAGLAAIVLAAIAELGFEAFLAAVVIAGGVQLVLGLIKAGRLAAVVPSSVVIGMLAAIGVLLLLQQFPYVLGTTPEKGVHGLALLGQPIHAIQHATLGGAIVGLSCLALLVLWETKPFAPIRSRVPGPLVAVGAGTAIAAVLGGFEGLALSHEMFVNMPHAGGSALSIFTFPDFGAFLVGATWRVAFTLAVVASIETLLSLEATDNLDPQKRHSNADQELIGQGLGNALAGLLGGLPMTGVIVRSTANITAGGKTWRSAFAHGVFLCVAVFAIPSLLEHIPLAALAAVLLHIGFKLAHPSRFAGAIRVGYRHAVPLFATVIAVVVTDLLIGVGVGLAVSLGFVLVSAARNGVHVEDATHPGRVRVRLSSAMSFLHKAHLRDALHSLPDGSSVTVDGSTTQDFDHDVVEFLHSFADRARDRGIDVQFVDVPERVAVTAH